MSVTEIPKSYKYTCDLCGTVHVQENANGHYTDSRPPYWSRLTLARDAHDFQGAPVADATVKRLLCPKCTTLVAEAINSVHPSKEKPPVEAAPPPSGEER